MTQSDEAHLVALVRKGDQLAYSDLVVRHLPAIEVYAKRIVNDDTLAQDIAQDVMVVLWQRSGDFNPAKARLTTWLHRIAHNRCIDIMRKRQREVSWDPHENDDMVSEPESASTEQQPIDAALMKLPESQRTALVLTYYQNLSNREVAEVMNSSTRAVESLLVRARGNLKKQLETQQ
jgi:RNA polymerase sigma-70 factor (ECF subfamily)